MIRSVRIGKELSRLETEPPPGVSCWMKGDTVDQLRAQIVGSEKTPYSDGVFELEIQVPERYPMEPPKVRFLTPIYHPNIDTAGRICLDLLKMPPSGSWKPSLSISTLLQSIKLLMSHPNPDDPLMADISAEFQTNRALFEQTAKQHTEKHATQKIRPHSSTASKATADSDDSSQSEASSDETDQSDSSSDEGEPLGSHSWGQKRDLGEKTQAQPHKKLREDIP